MANKNNDKRDRQPQFLEELKKSRGIIYPALQKIGIYRSTYRRWYNEDPDFARAVDEINEMQMDVVETKLLKLIDNNDTTAVIFYLKTKGKKRGYYERREVDATVESKDMSNPLQNLSFERLKGLYDDIQRRKKQTARKKTATRQKQTAKKTTK